MRSLTLPLRNRITALVTAVLGIGVAVAILALGGSTLSTATGATDALPEGASSTRVVELQEDLPRSQVAPAVLLITRADGAPIGAQGAAVADDVAAAAAQATGLEVPAPEIAEDGTAALVTVPLAASAATDAVADEVDALRTACIAELPEGYVLAVTGPAGVQADVSKIFDGANTNLLIATASVVALLLLLTYRSPWLWIVPLVVIGLADRVAVVLAVRVSDVTGIPVDDAGTGILSVLVFGAGTNYAFLLISRYRDELRVHENRFAAMRVAVVNAGEAIIGSALTVALALLTLLLSVFPTTRGLGLSGFVGIVTALVFALVVLPAALVLFGRRLFWPFAPKVGDAPAASANGVWYRLGAQVRRRPALTALGAVAVLVVMALGVTQVSSGLSQSEVFLDKPEAIAAQERVAQSFPAGATDPVEVIAPIAVAGDVRAAVAGVAGVAEVRDGASSDSIAQIDAVVAAAPGTDASYATVAAIRSAVADIDGVEVGGTLAKEADARDGVARDQRVIIPLILAIVVVILVFLLRALLAPALLVLTVLATYLASMGASWWIFRGVFDFPALDAGVPLLAFLFLVTLGVDYNIFLVTRAREEAAAHGTREGMLRALAATGGVITSAGILLAAVFAVLGVLPLVILAQIGIIVGIGVLLDTLVVRTVLVPALALLLGDRFWWPRRQIMR